MHFTILSRNQINSNQIKCWLTRRGENWSAWRKTSQSRVENQQTEAEPGNRTWATLVGGECSILTLRQPCSFQLAVKYIFPFAQVFSNLSSLWVKSLRLKIQPNNFPYKPLACSIKPVTECQNEN